MCLITDQLEPLTAQEDIKVYKLLSEDMSSIYQDFYYRSEELYETEFSFQPLEYNWHYYDDKAGRYLHKNYPCWNNYPYDDRKNLISVASGFHAALSEERHKPINEGKVFEATIPKGAQYYKDGTGLVVSNKIIIHG